MRSSHMPTQVLQKLLLAALLLSCVHYAASKRVFTASGGGIRATMGTVIAIDMLKGAGVTFDEFHALSGGGWGLALQHLQDLSGNVPMTWCQALKQSLKEEKSVLNPAKLKQTSHKVIGPRSASNPVDGPVNTADERWWTYWKDNVAKFTQVVGWPFKKLTAPRPPVYIHVAQLVADGEQTVAPNDCWFTNKHAPGANDFECVFDPANPLADFKAKSKAKTGAATHAFATGIKPLDALTYSSAAWSTLQAKTAMFQKTGVRFRRKCPKFKAGNTDIEVTDGGDFTNLPVYSIINDFYLNPQDTDVMAFDFTEPDADLSYCNDHTASKPCDPYYDISFSMEQIYQRLVIDQDAYDRPEKLRFKPTTWRAFDKCEGHATFKSGTHTLNIHFFGFCGPKKSLIAKDKGAEWLIDKFRTVEVTGGVVAGKGVAKQWTQDELDMYTQQYGDFLHERFQNLANLKSRQTGPFRARVFDAMINDAKFQLNTPDPCKFRE